MATDPASWLEFLLGGRRGTNMTHNNNFAVAFRGQTDERVSPEDEAILNDLKSELEMDNKQQ